MHFIAAKTYLYRSVEVVPELGGKTEALLLRSSAGLRSVLLDHGRNATAARANDAWKGPRHDFVLCIC